MDNRELLARVIQCEAGGEGDEGMRAVASVILNRVHQLQGEYGGYNTVRDVVFAPYQFECALSNRQQSLFNMSPTWEHYAIADWALSGGRLGSTGDALWFFNPFSQNCPDRFPNQNGYLINRIGDHCFYAPTNSYYST